MTNSFERHGIDHVSTSTLGKFASSPAMFVLEKLLKKPTSVGAAAHRGTAVEDGVTHGLMNPAATTADCQRIAIEKFRTLTALSVDPRKEKEAGGIGDMVAMALGELRPYGTPSATQTRVEVKVEGLAVPVMGFLDYDWDRHDTIVDLKTSWALQSEISLAHARQVSLYVKATGRKDGRVCYATNKKSATYGLENAEAHFQALVKIGLAMQRFLAVSDDPKELAMLVVPDVDHYYFNDPTTRQAAFDIWGI